MVPADAAERKDILIYFEKMNVLNAYLDEFAQCGIKQENLLFATHIDHVIEKVNSICYLIITLMFWNIKGIRAVWKALLRGRGFLPRKS